MNSSRRKLAAILEALGVPPSARRPAATPAAPACESLEGRQLLAGGLGLMDLGMAGSGVADVSARGFGPGVSGSIGTVNPGLGGSGLGYGAGASSSFVAANLGPGGGQSQAQADLEQLQADSQAIHDKSMVTPAMEHSVAADVKAIKAAETTTPSPTATAALQAATKSARSNVGGPSLGQVFSVEVAQNAVYMSEGVGAGPITQLDADEAAVMMATGITAADEATLAADASAVKADQARPSPLATTTTPAVPSIAQATTTTTIASTASASAMAIPAVPTALGSPGTGSFAGQSGSPLGPMGSDAPGMTLMTDFGMAPMAGLGLGGPGSAAASIPSVGQGTTSTTPPTTTTPPAWPTTPTADQTALRLDLEKLRIDTQAVHDKSQVTPAMEAVVRQDLETIRGAETAAPSPTATATLQADLKAAQAEAGGPTAAQTSQIQADRDAVSESQGVNASLVAKLDADRAAIRAASGVTAADEASLAADASAVKADQAKLTPVAPPSTTPATGSTTTPTTPPTMPTDPLMTPGHDFRMGGGFGPGGFNPFG